MSELTTVRVRRVRSPRARYARPGSAGCRPATT
jgi:hypothetical protein